MKTNKQNKTSITPSRRRELAMARILTNIRQIMMSDPSDQTLELIAQHSQLLNAMYAHHVKQSELEAKAREIEPEECDAVVDESIQVADEEAISYLDNELAPDYAPMKRSRGRQRPHKKTSQVSSAGYYGFDPAASNSFSPHPDPNQITSIGRW